MDSKSRLSDLHEVTFLIEQGSAPVRSAAIEKLRKTALEELPFDALLQCLELRQSDKISAEDLEPHLGAILTIWEQVYAQVINSQREGTSTEWMLEDAYRDARAQASVVLDLFGYLQSSAVSLELAKALKLLDSRLKAFAIVSSLRRGETVDPAEIEPVAASDEVRILLWEQLNKIGMKHLMPECWSTPEQLAGSDLVRWAAHPMELGTPPEEIELMVAFSIDFDGEAVEVYLFRFREYPKPWAPSEGWMAGIAGPYRDGERIGSPWSAFDAWDSRSPEQHFKKLIKNACWCELEEDDEDVAQ